MIISGGIGARKQAFRRISSASGPPSYSDDLTGGKSYTSDETAGSEYGPEKAFDDNLVTRWYATTAARHWIRVDFGDGTPIKIAKLRCYTEHNNYIGDFAFEGSNDGTSWTNVMSGSAPLGLTWYEFEFTNKVAYRYYRMYQDTNHAGYINEIEMMKIV